jgi:serine/threonine protein phosphatase PrpC
VRGGCTSCGAPAADRGDGVCRACGQSLDTSDAKTARPPPDLSPGDRVGDYEIVESTGDGTFLVVDPIGVRRFLAFADSGMIDDEEALLGGLAGDARFSPPIARGSEESRGSYLVLGAPPAASKRLGAIAEELPLAAAIAALFAVLDLATELEAMGLSFLPSPHDLYRGKDGALHVARLRHARRLGAGESFDARAMLSSLGEALVPEPLARGGALLVRALSTSHSTLSGTDCDVTTMRREIAAAVADHERASETPADVAVVCDQGLWRPYNQDSVAMATSDPPDRDWSVLVACDGVSSSSSSGLAASTAALTTRDALAHFAGSGDASFDSLRGAVATAIRAAHLAVCAEHIGADGDLPGTTIVAALVYQRRIIVGWIGDSRAWWITEDEATQLTRDHSWAADVVARGDMTEEQAMEAPEAHTITRCLGPLEVGDQLVEVDPDVLALRVDGPGVLVLATDGLWNYAPSANDVADLVRAAGKGASATAIARLLTACALARGGQDNVSVGVAVLR